MSEVMGFSVKFLPKWFNHARGDFHFYSAQMLNKDKSQATAVGEKERPLQIKLPRNEKPSAQPRTGQS